MNYLTYLEPGTAVVARSYVSGILVGRIHCGAGGVVGLTEWRWIRRWEGVGGEGSVYDLVRSGVTPSRRGPFTEELTLVQQADIMVISEDAYERLAK
jgi:hypothetical protein